MNCKNCGTPLNGNQGFCPNCGASSNSINMNIASFNVSEPTGSSFNNNAGNMSNQFGSNDPFANGTGTMPNNMLINPMGSGVNVGQANVPMNNQVNNQFGNQMNIPSGMKMPEEGGKKFPWIILAIVLLVIMVVGVIVYPLISNLKVSTFENDSYVLEYNSNWKLDESAEKMTLYYTDNQSRFMLNGITTFESLNFQINSETDKKNLYEEFYKIWSNVEGGTLTGGTKTFLELENDGLYARFDYKLTNSSNIGAFYVIVNEDYNSVISFLSLCTESNWEEIDNDILTMLNTLTYKGQTVSEKETAEYSSFYEGVVKDYSSIGYMDYKIPDCWTYDDARSAAVAYKSSIFKFKDGASLLDVKGITAYDSSTGTIGTSYEKMKASVINVYGAVKEEKQMTVNGKVWYVIITPDYTSGTSSYHNEIYFTLSASNAHIYYLEIYVDNGATQAKLDYIRDSVEFILNSATLHKVDE